MQVPFSSVNRLVVRLPPSPPPPSKFSQSILKRMVGSNNIITGANAIHDMDVHKIHDPLRGIHITHNQGNINVIKRVVVHMIDIVIWVGLKYSIAVIVILVMLHFGM